MKVKALHPSVSNIKSYLTAKANSGQKDLVVLNATNFSANQFVVIGTLGEESCEIGKIASISGNTITLTANLGVTHAENTPITVIDYDQVELWKATTETGTYALVSGTITDLSADEEFTLLEDADAVSTDYFKIKYYNSHSETYSEFSDSLSQAGFSRYALASIQDHVLKVAEDEKEKRITRSMITEWANQWKDLLANRIIEINEKYFITYREYTLVSGTAEYTLLGKVTRLNKVEANLDGGDSYRVMWEDLEDDNPDYVYSASNPRYYLNAGKIGFRPTPTATGTAKVWQEEIPADLDDDGDELTAPMRYYLLNLYDFLDYQVNKQFRKQTAADSAWAKFDRGLDEIIEEINCRVEDQNRGVKESDEEYYLS